jgi:hypothetical protein
MRRISKRFLFCFCLVFFAAVPVSQAQTQGKRVDMVMGNRAYADSPQKNPRNDAQDMGEALENVRAHGS